MFENSAIRVATGKLASSTAPFIPGTLILLSGFVVWKIWQKQSQLQTKTSELSDELKTVRRQISKIKADKPKETKKVANVASEQAAALSSSFKNFFKR